MKSPWKKITKSAKIPHNHAKVGKGGIFLFSDIFATFQTSSFAIGQFVKIQIGLFWP